MSDPNAPDWAKLGFDDPDAYDVPGFEGSGAPRQATRHPVGCRCLGCLLMRLRMELRAETPSVLHSHSTPVLRDYDGIVSTQYPDEGGVGPPFSAAFHRYLEHADHWGLARLGMASIIEASEWCAARHPAHRRPLFTRTICGELVFQAAVLGQTLDDLAWLHDRSVEAIAGMLTATLLHSEDWRVNRFARLTKEPGVPQPYPERRPIRPAA